MGLFALRHPFQAGSQENQTQNLHCGGPPPDTYPHAEKIALLQLCKGIAARTLIQHIPIGLSDYDCGLAFVSSVLNAARCFLQIY